MKRKLFAITLIAAMLINTLSGVVMAAEPTHPVLLPDTNTNVTIDTAGQVATYQFVADHSCGYAFHAISDEDTYGELYDDNGNLLYENDDYYGLNFGIECVLEAGKTYILKVCFLDTAVTGVFELATSTNHDAVSDLTKAAGCYDDGLWTHRCMTCGYVWTESIPAEHNFENGLCTECGAGMLLNGVCGESLFWTYDGTTKTLSITGTGAMYHYVEDSPPWYDLAELVAEIVVADGVTSIGHGAFSAMKELRTVCLPDSVTTIGNHAFSYCGKLDQLTLPNSMDEIGAFAFSYCNGLRSVFVPSAVNTIGFGAFQGCGTLKAITVDTGNTKYSSDSYNVLFDKEKHTLLQAPAALKGSYSIPDTVRVIGDSAFEGCDQLSALTISANVSEVGSYAFSGCKSLTFLQIPAGVGYIGDGAFSNCNALDCVLFEGDAPAVDGVIFDTSNATACYQAENSTWTKEAMAACGESVLWKPLFGLSIVAEPQSREALMGNTVTYVVGAYGNGLQYAWWLSGPDGFTQSENTSAILTLEVNFETVGRQLYCVVTDETGAEVRTQVVTVCAMPVFAENQLVCVTLEGANEFKYYAYTPKYSCFYTICAYGSCDSYLEVYDEGYHLIAENDDGADHNFSLRHFLEAGKTYILGVCIYDNAAGEIQVKLQTSHDFITTETPPGCTTDGYVVFSCNVCQYSYQLPAGIAGSHSWVNATCTTPKVCSDCGMVEGDALGHDYIEVVHASTCTAAGYVSYNCPACGDSYSKSLPATGHSFVEGICTACGVQEGTSTGMPTVTLAYPALNFKDVVYYNVYYTISDVTDVIEMGLITFDGPNSSGTIDDAMEIISGSTASGNKYMVHSNGIHAKHLGDALYFKVYAKLSDGSYVYSGLAGYHAVAYAKDILANSTDAKMKSLVVAMLNYGAAAQVQFNYKTDSLMNSFLSSDQKALVEDYSKDMVAGIQPADTGKFGDFTYQAGGYTALYPSISFEGAFSVNFYFSPAKAMDGDLTMYYWSVADYKAADVLTPENATGKIIMEKRTGSYIGTVAGIAARQIDETIYVAGVYESGGTVYPTGVIAYSLGAYCADRATNDTGTMQALAMQTAVYGYYAKMYFASAMN